MIPLIADEFGILCYWHAGIQLSICIIAMDSKTKVPHAHFIILFCFVSISYGHSIKIINNIELWPFNPLSVITSKQRLTPTYCRKTCLLALWKKFTWFYRFLVWWKYSWFLESEKPRESIPENTLDILVFSCHCLLLVVYDMMVTLLLTLSVLYTGIRNWPWYGTEWFIWPKWQ